MSNSVTISLQRTRERQYELTVGEYSYGEWMSYLRAKDLGEHIYSVLCDLKESGIISEDTRINFVDKVNGQATSRGTTDDGPQEGADASPGLDHEDGGPER